MRKKTKKKNSFEIKKLYPILLLVATLFMGIGYAAVNSVLLDISGNLTANLYDGVFITEATYKSGVGTNEDSSKITSAYQTFLNSTVKLSETDSSSSVTFSITIYNNSQYNQIFTGVTYDSAFYDNSYITYSLSGLAVNDIVKPGADNSVTFDLTFKYTDNAFTDGVLTAENVLNSCLSFNFEEYVLVNVTFDRSFLPNNQFENLYDTSEYVQCCGNSAWEDYFSYVRTTTAADGLTYEATRFAALTTGEWDRGYFFRNKVARPLTDGVTYTLMFESKGSDPSFTAIIGCEQDPSIHIFSQQYLRKFTIKNSWQRHTITFTADTNDEENLFSFVVYDWASSSSWRTLKLRNVQLQSGTASLYTESSTLRSDKPIGTLPTPTRSGWTFAGWYTSPLDGEKITSETIVPRENVTYYAQWTYNNV